MARSLRTGRRIGRIRSSSSTPWLGCESWGGILVRGGSRPRRLSRWMTITESHTSTGGAQQRRFSHTTQDCVCFDAVEDEVHDGLAKFVRGHYIVCELLLGSMLSFFFDHPTNPVGRRQIEHFGTTVLSRQVPKVHNTRPKCLCSRYRTTWKRTRARLIGKNPRWRRCNRTRQGDSLR